MKLKAIAANQNEIETSDGTLVFFSYKTPVAAFISGQGIIRTKKKWSSTTSRHINQWIGANAPTATVSEVEQETLDSLID